MDEHLEIENILNTIDFSQGREKAVWEKIEARLHKAGYELTFEKYDNVGGGLSFPNIADHCENFEDF